MPIKLKYDRMYNTAPGDYANNPYEDTSDQDTKNDTCTFMIRYLFVVLNCRAIII